MGTLPYKYKENIHKFSFYSSHFMRTVLWEERKPKTVDEAIVFILRLSSDTYESLYYQMPEKQRMLFLAIAREDDQFFPLWLKFKGII